MYLISKFDYSFIIVILFMWKKRLKPLQYVICSTKFYTGVAGQFDKTPGAADKV